MQLENIHLALHTGSDMSPTDPLHQGPDCLAISSYLEQKQAASPAVCGKKEEVVGQFSCDVWNQLLFVFADGQEMVIYNYNVYQYQDCISIYRPKHACGKFA